MRKGFALILLVYFSGCGERSKSTPGSSVSASAVPVAAELAISARLAALAANPQSRPPTKKFPKQGWTTYHYKESGADEVTLTVPDAGTAIAGPAWQIKIVKPQFKASQLGPANGSIPAAMTQTGPWLQFISGSLKDSFAIDMPDGSILLTTAANAAASRDPALAPWVCKKNLVPGLKNIDDIQVEVACKELVKEQLLSPKSADFAGIGSGAKPPAMQPDCTQVWSSYVDAKNAFNVELRKKFTCTYEPRTGMVSVKFL